MGTQQAVAIPKVIVLLNLVLKATEVVYQHEILAAPRPILTSATAAGVAVASLGFADVDLSNQNISAKMLNRLLV